MLSYGLKMTRKSDATIQLFMDDFDKLMKKYSLDDLILINFDDDEMGYRQLVKISDTEEGRLLVFCFSGKGDVLCPSCAENNDPKKVHHCVHKKGISNDR